MAFRVAARTILELGAELISSDAIALYELIKNAIDAGSDSGVEIDFVITLSRRSYRGLERAWEVEESTLDALREKIRAELEPDALDENVSAVAEQLEIAKNREDIWAVVEHAYRDLSYIEIRDTGTGMTLTDLKEAFLTIGTPRRAKLIESALADGAVDKPPALGEKGVGRLSAMRLGDTLEVNTTTAGSHHINRLSIDWRSFSESLDAMLEDIPVDPEIGSRKADTAEHGTTLRIGSLIENWTKSDLETLARKQLARITDPFETGKRRFGIYLSYNGIRIDFTRYVRKVLLNEAHAIVKGEYLIDQKGEPTLTIRMQAPFFERSEEKELYTAIDLVSLAADRLGDIPLDALTDLGPFRFDLYWFNRQRLKKPVEFETLKQFRGLVQNWSGIMLYRDGYQVLPYGDEDTDWLELDRAAFGSGGYKLNKSQFVGRVAVSRLANSALVDQTNREGLRDCDEKTALIGILRFVIRNRLKSLLEECARAAKQSTDDGDNPKLRQREVTNLAKRARDTIKQVEPKRSEDRVLLKQVLELFGDLETRYRAAEKRIEAANDERERLIDLAGIGLIIETLAHELTRTVEHSAELLSRQKKQGLPPEIRQFFSSLKASMAAIEKRLKIIDPLSVSGRQRRRDLDLKRIVDSVVDSHGAQFERHKISVHVNSGGAKKIPLFAVEGRIIQILENLISNSVYWIKAQRQIAPNAPRRLDIRLTSHPMAGFKFTDSGPGIPPERAKKVFEPFFSTKPEQTRQGLGLYIARECASFHGGSISLDPDDRNDRGNLRTFVVEIPDSRKAG